MKVERYQAEVSSIDDPEMRGRLKVRCPALLDRDAEAGETEAPELPDWIDPAFGIASVTARTGSKAGFFFVPRPGDVVDIEVDENAELETEGGIRWLASSYLDQDFVPEIFSGGHNLEYGKVIGFYSYGGHVVFIYDQPGSDGAIVLLRAFDPDNGTARQRIVIGKDFSTGTEGLFFEDNYGNSFQITEGGWRFQAPNGSWAEADQDQTSIGFGPNEEEFLVKAGVAGPELHIGKDPGEPLVLGNVMNTILTTVWGALATHIHKSTEAFLKPDGSSATVITSPPESPTPETLNAASSQLGAGENLSDIAKTKKG